MVIWRERRRGEETEKLLWHRSKSNSKLPLFYMNSIVELNVYILIYVHSLLLASLSPVSAEKMTMFVRVCVCVCVWVCVATHTTSEFTMSHPSLLWVPTSTPSIPHHYHGKKEATSIQLILISFLPTSSQKMMWSFVGIYKKKVLGSQRVQKSCLGSKVTTIAMGSTNRDC